MNLLEECIKRSPRIFIKKCHQFAIKPIRVLVPLLIFTVFLALSSTEGYKIFFALPIYKTLLLINPDSKPQSVNEREDKHDEI